MNQTSAIGRPRLAPDRSALARRYDHAARHYDYLAEIVLARVLNVERHRNRLIAMLGDLDGARVLDVGCGTGRNFPLLIKAIGAQGRLIGVDCSSGMLQQAAQRVAAAGWHNVELVNDDAFALASVREPVDALVSAWCYGEVTPLLPALESALDTIRPGGRFAIMSFAQPRPASGPLHWLYPACRFGARCIGIDTDEVLNGDKVMAKWHGAIELLRSRLDDVRVERYSNDALLAVSGRTRMSTRQ